MHSVTFPFEERYASRLGNERLIIGETQSETRTLPAALMPSRIETRLSLERMELAFDYLIEERADSKGHVGDHRVEVIVGKHTKKVLSLHIPYQNISDIDRGIDTALGMVRTMGDSAFMESVRYSYKIVCELLSMLKPQILSDVQSFLERQAIEAE